MNMTRTKAHLMLMVTAIIWGTSFVAQKSGMDSVGPFFFSMARFAVGGLALIPVILFFSKKNKSLEAEKPEKTAEEKKAETKLLLIGSVICGIIVFFGTGTQQVGMVYTTAGKAGLITTMYIIIVPIISIFLGKKPRNVIWGCVIAAIVGLALLCLPAGESLGGINRGDIIMIAAAFGFAAHILAVDYFSPKVDGLKLSCIQFLVASAISLIVMVPADAFIGYDMPTFTEVMGALVPILYLGLGSSGVGYTLQILAQPHTEPTIASIIMSSESMIAVIAGMLILGETLSTREFIGCAIMLIVIVVAQLPEKRKNL